MDSAGIPTLRSFTPRPLLKLIESFCVTLYVSVCIYLLLFHNCNYLSIIEE